VSLIEWMLVVEGVLLATAGMFRLAGLAIKPQPGEEVDPFTSFYTTFWKVFLRRRGRLKSAVSSLDVQKARQYQEMKYSGNVEGIKELLENEFGQHAFDESEISQALDDSIAGKTEGSDALSAMAGGVGAGATAGIGGATEKPRAGLVNVKVIPFATTNELVSIRRDGFTIQVTCGPEEGQANKSVIDLVAESLQVQKYQVTLIKGHYKPFKVIQVAGYDQSDLDMKLASYS
jgi:uncharacterized protein YggU (UPF0235/DUF167 family)